MYKRFLKRLLDLLIAVPAFLILFPFISLTAIMLLCANRGKVFFLQRRPGLNNKIFNIVKFKTMNDATDQNGNLLPDSQRLTKVGLFVRKTSLDETPQLLNVIIGQMSLVGPRPLLVQYLSLYDDNQRRRHEVKPGITGWAQVNGRNNTTWNQRFTLDVWYVDNLSMKLDFKILMLTVKKVFAREGIEQNGHATMEIFRGNRNEI